MNKAKLTPGEAKKIADKIAKQKRRRRAYEKQRNILKYQRKDKSFAPVKQPPSKKGLTLLDRIKGLLYNIVKKIKSLWKRQNPQKK